jgi:hypothetical protein
MVDNMNRSNRKTLCIGMATYDDYDGVYFSVQAIRLFHPEVTNDTEILVIDNHPEGPCAADLKALENWVSGYRYVPFNRFQGTAVRDVVFQEANADFVLCIDCHVMFAPGALRRLLDYICAHPDSQDLLQGPLVYDDLRSFSTHMDPSWSHGMYGVWGTDPRAADADGSPFEIGMQGLGAFACRKSSWPGFNPQLRGFGGEEGYIHEKFHRAGGRTLCLPFLRWVHRFGRPMGVPYKNTWEDRIRNYLIIADELGNDPAAALEHFRMHVGREAADPIISAVQSELRNPFHFFEAIYCINLAHEMRRWQEVMGRFARLGFADRVRRFEGIPTSPNPHVGCGLSHRAVVEDATRRGLANFLVFEDDVLFTSDAIPGLQAGLRELRGREWNLLYLGGCRWGTEFPAVEGTTRLARAGAVTSCHAIAYDRSICARVLSEVPDNAAGMERWLETHHGIDQYYAFSVTEKKYLLSPVIATQPSILPMESDEVRRSVWSS